MVDRSFPIGEVGEEMLKLEYNLMSINPIRISCFRIAYRSKENPHMKSKSLVIDSHDSRKIADSISDALRTIVEQSKDPLVDLSCDGHPEIKVEELENEMICINSGDSSIEIPRNCVLKLADELKKLGNDNDS